ncbi:Metallopeptidase [Gracilaria domingensis]|nr:Metallopeptidase [Gracilaria domingensis]
MDQPTIDAAIDKLNAINWKVGYSEKLDTYDDVDITTSFQSNVHSAIAHLWRKRLNRLGNPIDNTEWFMKPHEVNAYYSVTRNEMVFPAGILQPPFFSDAYPEAMNYGSIGAVIGHEMSHGFDDQGRQYDKAGMLTPWWSDSSVSKYKQKAQCYIDLYDTYKPRDVDIHVRGNLTLGENLADTNGVNVAFRAFKSRANNSQDGIPPPNALLARELTNDQLFFVAYAQTWCTLHRHEALKVDIMTDPHSPAKFRVLGPLSESPVFAEAFSCRNGSRYNPTTRCELW